MNSSDTQSWLLEKVNLDLEWLEEILRLEEEKLAWTLTPDNDKSNKTPYLLLWKLSK